MQVCTDMLLVFCVSFFPYPRFGRCVPYKIVGDGHPCNTLYAAGVDYVYINFQRMSVSFDEYLTQVEMLWQSTTMMPGRCLEFTRQAVCHFYVPSCGNSTLFEPPSSLCMETCNSLADTCPFEWEQMVNYFETNHTILSPIALIDCNNTGEFLNPVPHCCVDLGVNMCKLIECVHDSCSYTFKSVVDHATC